MTLLLRLYAIIIIIIHLLIDLIGYIMPADRSQHGAGSDQKIRPAV